MKIVWWAIIAMLLNAAGAFVLLMQSSKLLDPAGKGKHTEINDLFQAFRTIE